MAIVKNLLSECLHKNKKDNEKKKTPNNVSILLRDASVKKQHVAKQSLGTVSTQSTLLSIITRRCVISLTKPPRLTAAACVLYVSFMWP